MDIDNVSLEELAWLHKKICEGIRELNRVILFDTLQRFEVGDEVSFKHEGNTIT